MGSGQAPSSLSHKLNATNLRSFLRDAFKKIYLDRKIIPISSDTSTIGPVSEHLDREYW